MTHRLVPQSYGISMAQCVFGGPRGVWLECSCCTESQRIVGSPDPMGMTDADIAKVYRANGWSGVGARMKRAKCPACAKKRVLTKQPLSNAA